MAYERFEESPAGTPTASGSRRASRACSFIPCCTTHQCPSTVAKEGVQVKSKHPEPRRLSIFATSRLARTIEAASMPVDSPIWSSSSGVRPRLRALAAAYINAEFMLNRRPEPRFKRR